MKELSIEEKAKAYDKALKYAMIYYKDGNEDMKMMMKTCFPVLTEESKDERIMRCIGMCLTDANEQRFIDYSISLKDCIDWLEKQGKNNMGISEATKKKLEDSLNEALEKETPESFNKFLDEQGEQKPDNELKFEIGDLITNGILVGKIDEIHELGYHAYFGDHYADVPDVENWHKWTIADAKDGDVLACESGWTCIFKSLNDDTFSSYCFMDNTKWFCETGSECHTLNKAFIKAYNGEIHPATKKQRDLLFKKMHEAGYEWDSEKLELKKIEQSIAWSKEDEKMITAIRKLISDVEDETGWNCVYSDNKEIYFSEINNWFDSLKERYTWRPSEEQMNSLKQAINAFPYETDHLDSLYEQLKKL